MQYVVPVHYLLLTLILYYIPQNSTLLWRRKIFPFHDVLNKFDGIYEHYVTFSKTVNVIFGLCKCSIIIDCFKLRNVRINIMIRIVNWDDCERQGACHDFRALLWRSLHLAYLRTYIYISFKTLFYVVRHLDSIASCLPTGLHLGFFRSWRSLYLPSSFSSVFLVLSFVSVSTSMLFWVIFLLPFSEHGRTM